MDIVLADSMGFCMGVRRAVDLVYETLEKFPSEPLYMLGPIIHNRQVVQDFESRGVVTVNSAVDVPRGGRVVIRAHGVAPQVKEELRERECIILEGTCPKVIASQKFVEKYASDGYHIYIAGDRNHGEVIGLSGFASSVDVIDSPETAKTIPVHQPALLLAQTTVRDDEFLAISRILEERCPTLVIKNSICGATASRQKALINLMETCDGILVVGGRTSANTRRLVLTAEASGLPVWHIETAGEIGEEILSCRKIGITAGASTPDSIIKEVVSELT